MARLRVRGCGNDKVVTGPPGKWRQAMGVKGKHTHSTDDRGRRRRDAPGQHPPVPAHAISLAALPITLANGAPTHTHAPHPHCLARPRNNGTCERAVRWPMLSITHSLAHFLCSTSAIMDGVLVLLPQSDALKWP